MINAQTEKKVAVVLFNLGGPDRLESVKPFLLNLFRDPAILGLPALLRWPLAALIAGKREEEAKHIYSAIGGKSPLLENTRAQGAALETALNLKTSGSGSADVYKCFIAMRYWHPFSAETAKAVAAWQPDAILYLPLYPQFSTTTTASSFADFDRYLKLCGVSGAAEICCYPALPGFISALAEHIRPRYEAARRAAEAKGRQKPPRLLLSAHGLPEKVIRAGDPYQAQCEQTARAVAKELGIPGLDYVNCYQSRVGPLKWTQPYTDAEIERAGAEGVPVVIAPIAFVSEHSETLYEIEQQYRALAAEKGVPAFERVPAVGTHPAFIEGLAALALAKMADTVGRPRPDCGFAKCPAKTRAHLPQGVAPGGCGGACACSSGPASETASRLSR